MLIGWYAIFGFGQAPKFLQLIVKKGLYRPLRGLLSYNKSRYFTKLLKQLISGSLYLIYKV